jgi:metal-sulfur cluster biosynthetic enzyme
MSDEATTDNQGTPETPANEGAAAVADEKALLEALHAVIDPELGISIVDLGLVYDIHLEDGRAMIDMTLTSAGCPLTDVIEEEVAEALRDLVSGVRINWVWIPPWGPDRITPDGRDQLRALGFNV